MFVKIEGKNYPLHFGIGFVRELDTKYKTGTEVEFGTGVTSIYARLQSPNPYALYEAMHAALMPELDLTEEQFDAWVDGFNSEREYVNFFGRFVKELKKARQTKPLIRNYEQIVKEILKKNQEEKPVNRPTAE